MSVATRASLEAFQAAMRPAWDLVEIHKRLSDGVGRRESELSLNRGVVVFAVAAWQTYVERLTLAMLTEAAPPPNDPTMRVYQMLRTNIERQVKRLNVPDVQNARDLWSWLNFDPTPAWSLTVVWEKQRSVQHRGRISGQASLTAQQAKDELDTWVQIRHKIAHGDVIPAEARFQTLATGQIRGVPRLKRADADRCLNFFERVVTVTDVEASRTFP